MKFISQVVLTIVLCFVLQYFLPWWTVAVGAFGAGLLARNKGYLAFLAGFLGAGLLWGGMAWYSEIATHEILSGKIDRLLPLHSLLLTTVTGGLVGGFAALTGATLRHR